MPEATAAWLKRTQTSSEEVASCEGAAVVRNLAHELRQPLSTIEMLAYYLEMSLPEHEAKARVQAERIQRLVRQASWIVSEALRSVEGPFAPRERVDLDEVVSEAVAEWGRAVPVPVHLELCDQPTEVIVDREQAGSLVKALLSCIRELGGPAARLTVRTEAPPHEAVVEVNTDTCNIDEEELDRTLEASGAPQPTSGSPAFLANAQRIAEAHGGTLKAFLDPVLGLSVSVALPSAY